MMSIKNMTLFNFNLLVIVYVFFTLTMLIKIHLKSSNNTNNSDTEEQLVIGRRSLNDLLAKYSSQTGCYYRFMIVGFQRSGTTMFDELLDTHPHLSSRGELMHPYLNMGAEFKYQNDTSKKLQYLCEKTSFEPPVRYSGFKLLVEQFKKHNLTFQQLYEKFERPKLIFIYRQNLFEQWVSLVKAVRENIWNANVTHAPKLKLNVTMKSFKSYRTFVTEKWKRLAADLETLQVNSDVMCVSYEQMIKNTTHVMRQVIRWLSLDPDLAPDARYRPKSVKLGKPSNFSSLILNYTQVFEPYLNDTFTTLYFKDIFNTSYTAKLMRYLD